LKLTVVGHSLIIEEKKNESIWTKIVVG
jgi:hypothetical protein